MKKIFQTIFFLLTLTAAVSAQAQNDLDRLNQAQPQDFGAVTTAGRESRTLSQKNGMQKQANEDRSEKGHFRIRPYFKQQFELTDNVFHDPNGDKSSNAQTTRKGDAIWTETPGVNVTYTKGTLVAGASYEADFKNFTKYSNQNAQNQSAGGILQFQPTENTYVNASELFEQRELTSGFVDLKPVKVTQNDVRVTGGYQQDRLTIETGYRNFARHFSSDVNTVLDYFQNEYSVAAYHNRLDQNFMPFVKQKLIQIDYTNDQELRDALASDTRFGLIGYWPDRRLKIRTDAGFYLRDNRKSEQRNDPDYFVGSVLIQKTIFKNTALEAGFYREPREATFRNATVYISNAFYAGVSHPFTKKLTGRVNLITDLRRYPDAVSSGGVSAKRHDQALTLDAGLDYTLCEYAALRLDYMFERQDSNFHAFDYTENSLIAKVIFAL